MHRFLSWNLGLAATLLVSGALPAQDPLANSRVLHSINAADHANTGSSSSVADAVGRVPNLINLGAPGGQQTEGIPSVNPSARTGYHSGAENAGSSKGEQSSLMSVEIDPARAIQQNVSPEGQRPLSSARSASVGVVPQILP